MMTRSFKTLKLGAALLAGSTLLGCQMGSLVPTGLPKVPETMSAPQAAAPVAEATLPAETALPQVEMTSQLPSEATQGSVTIAIKWPERPRSIQAIPLSANSMRIRIFPTDGGEDLYNDLIGRSDTLASPDPNHQNPSPMVRKYFLKKGVSYQIAISVYKEQPQAVTESSEAIAFTETPAEVTLSANETKAVKLVLKALNTPTVTDASYAAGGGAIVTVTGSGFGTNASLIRAEWVKSEWDKPNLEVVEVTDTAVKVKMPANSWGQGPLNVYRDGVKANGATTLAYIGNFDMPADNTLAIKRSDQTFDTYYAIADRAFPFLLTKAEGKAFTNLVYSVKVKDNDTQQDVTDTMLAGGQFTLSEGSYTVTFTSGSLTKDITIEAGTVTWAADPLPFVVAPYYIPGYPTANKVPLSGYYLLMKDNQSIPFKKSDFTWTFSSPGVAMADPDNQWDESNYHFKAAASTGPVTLKGTLRYDSSRVVQATVTNAKISAFNLQQANDPDAWSPTWSSVSDGTALTVQAGQKIRIRVRSVKLTNNATPLVNSDWAFRDQLEWTSLLQGTQDPGDDVATVEKDSSNDSQTDLVITGVAAGTVTVRLIHKGDPTQERLLTVNVTQ